MKSPETMLVVSHVVHYRHHGRLAAYGPYAREIDIWADLFPRVIIAAPCRDAAPPRDCLPFSRPNISIDPQVEAGGDTVAAKIKLLACLPKLVVGLSRAMSQADAIHVRCPGNLGLIGVALGPLFSRPLVAKYAGQWNGFPDEPLAGRLERYILGSRWWRAPVTVYGTWPDQPSHVVPFFTSMLGTDQVQHAVDVAERKRIERPLRVLFSGMLEQRKRVDALLGAAKILRDQSVPIQIAIVGDGGERDALVRQVTELKLGSCVRFVGALPFESALEWYEWAHCLVLPSTHSEGWPKVVAEAMTYGVLCLAVDHGQVATMLKDRGILLRSGSPEEIANALREVASNPDPYRAMTYRASRWARQYSLEGLREALATLLSERWNMPIRVQTTH